MFEPLWDQRREDLHRDSIGPQAVRIGKHNNGELLFGDENKNRADAVCASTVMRDPKAVRSQSHEPAQPVATSLALPVPCPSGPGAGSLHLTS